MPTILENDEQCRDCVSIRCGLHHRQSQALHKLYHDAEDEWRLCTGQPCIGFQTFPDWRDRDLFAEAHRLLSIALCARRLHTGIFWTEDENYGGFADEGHREAMIQLAQMRTRYEYEAGANGKAFIRVTSDREVMENLFRALEKQVTADTNQDGQYDYILRIPNFATYKEVSPGTRNSIYRVWPPSPPNNEDTVW